MVIGIVYVLVNVLKFFELKTAKKLATYYLISYRRDKCLLNDCNSQVITAGALQQTRLKRYAQ